MTEYSCPVDSKVSISLLDGRTLLLGKRSAFVDLADAAAQHQPLATTRAILNIQSNSVNGLRKFKHVLADMAGLYVYRFNTRTVIARIRNLVNTHRLVALLLPPLCASECSADGAGLDMAPAAIKDGAEIEKISITDQTRFEDLGGSLPAKLKYVVLNSGKHFKSKEIAEKFAKAMTASVLISTVAVLVIWAGSHFVGGAGFAIDAVLIAVGWIFIGWAIFSMVKDMVRLFLDIKKADNLEELDAASKRFAEILVQFGVDTLVGLLTRGAGKIKRNLDTKRKTGAAGSGSNSRGANKKRAEQRRKEETEAKRKAKPKSREDIIDERIKTDPKVARDIAKDETAIYGYSPKAEAKGLGGLTKVDYSDAGQVANARKHRSAYKSENAKMEREIAARRQKILDEGGDYNSAEMKDLAEDAVNKRNRLRHESNKQSGTVDAVETANLHKYQNKEGPTFKYLHDKKGKSVEQILDSSAKPNKGADIVVGLWP